MIAPAASPPRASRRSGAKRWVFGTVAVFVAGWLILGGLVYSRNRMPEIVFPQAAAMPAGNVYEDYLACVGQVRLLDRSLFEKGSQRKKSPEERRKIIDANTAVLKRLHDLNGKSSVVTKIEPGVSFTPAVDFPRVGRLEGLAAEDAAGRDPAQAIGHILDGLAFVSGVIRGGAILQLTCGYMGFTPLAESFPDTLSGLSADQARSAAGSAAKIIQELFPLSGILDNERGMRMRQLTKTFGSGAAKGFKLNIPMDKPQFDYLMKPKGKAVESVNAYYLRWVAEAKKPAWEMRQPDPATGLEGLINDESMSPGAVMRNAGRYVYLTARMRLMYTALKLEEKRKSAGSYPDSLDADDLFIDPFSGKPFVYKRQGGSYILYSVGPNGQDDGGQSMQEGRLSTDRPGDLLLRATF